MSTLSRKATVFIALTFGLSGLFFIICFSLAGPWIGSRARLIGLGYMYMPALAAAITQIIYRQRLKGPLGFNLRPNRWFLIAWLLAPVAALLSLAISLLVPGVSYTTDMTAVLDGLNRIMDPADVEQTSRFMEAWPVHPFWISLGQGLVLGPSLNALFALGEELGWRGLLLNELKHLGLWRSSRIIGLIWGVWHAPFILLGHNYPENPVAGIFMMIGFTLVAAPVLSYLRLRSGSVLAPALLHGTLNGLAALPLLVLRGGSDLTVGLTGLAGLAAFGLINVVLYYFRGKFLKKDSLLIKPGDCLDRCDSESSDRRPSNSPGRLSD
jgi:membrane protease YdiL (CAAX protease family)